MKLSLALVAVATSQSTTPGPTEAAAPALPAICEAVDGITNCWAPSGIFQPVVNGTNEFFQVNDGGECGFQFEDGQSMTNNTCTVSGTVSGSNLFFGNAAFVDITGVGNNNQVIGLALSGKVNLLQTWDITFDDTDDFNNALQAHITESIVNKNYTGKFSWDKPKTAECFAGLNSFNVVCEPTNLDGNASNKLAIMWTNQEADSVNSYALANYGSQDRDTYAVTLNTPCSSVEAFDANQATLTLSNADDCTFFVHVHSGRADLLYFQAAVSGKVDFFQVSG